MDAFSISRRVFLRGLAVLLSLSLFVPSTAGAALLYLNPESAEVSRGDTITLAVRIDTDEGECINAADVVIEYSDSVRAVDVSRGESIFSVWVEEPVINEDENIITFAGGVPGGYCGRIPGDPRLTNILAELVFRSPGLNIGGRGSGAEVRFRDATQVLLNDGFGTKAPLQTIGAELTLLEGAGQTQIDDWADRISEDDIPPANFSIILSRDDDAFSGQYFISFSSQDKQSGIDRYEVMEEPFEDFELFRWGRADAPWSEATSPYVLKDQTLNSTIRVRAIDKAGNQTVATLVPEPALRSMSLGRIMTIASVVVISLIVAGAVAYGLYRRKKNLIEHYEHEDDDIA